ncbi:trypsin-like peptidase domain-containing protein [Dermacoccaceae bacterium W4C1]
MSDDRSTRGDGEQWDNSPGDQTRPIPPVAPAVPQHGASTQAPGSSAAGAQGQYGQQASQGQHAQQASPGHGSQYGQQAPYGQQNQQSTFGQPQQESQSSGFATPAAQPAPWTQQQPQFTGAPQHNSQHQGAGWSGGTATTAAPASGKRNRFAVPVAALLAAALASGGTYALTSGDDSSSPAAATNTTVVQGNPADYADAGTVNWSATAQKVTPSVVSITATSGSSGGRGSGVVWDKDGNIVTNNHVVSGAEKLTVTLADNRTYEAKIVGTDPSTDLAVIKIQNPPSNLTPISLGDDSKLVVGQPTMAVGNPLGLSGTVTTGIVSALNRPVETEESSEQDQGQSDENGLPGQSQEQQGSSDSNVVVTNAIQTSAAINPGNSGGALVNGTGQLIGINSSIASLSGSSGSSQSGNIGIGFAIPVTVVKNIAGQLIKSGKAQHALLGVSATNGTVEVDGASQTGAKVASVESGSGAAKAGLKEGDLILSIDGENVDGSTSLVGQVRERAVGTRVTLSVVRDGKRQNVTVTLGTAPTS